MNYLSLADKLQNVYSPRVALRPLAICDAWPLFEATRNPIFNQFLTWPAPTVESEAFDRVSLIQNAIQKGQMCAVAAVVRSTGEWIGVFRFQPYFIEGNIVEDAMETGIWARDTFWRGNYSLEVGVMCIDAAFKFTDVSVVYASAATENRSSCALLRRGGLQPGRTFKKTTEMFIELQAQEFYVTRESWLAQDHAKKYFRIYDQFASQIGLSPESSIAESQDVREFDFA